MAMQPSLVNLIFSTYPFILRFVVLPNMMPLTSAEFQAIIWLFRKYRNVLISGAVTAMCMPDTCKPAWGFEVPMPTPLYHQSDWLLVSIHWALTVEKRLMVSKKVRRRGKVRRRIVLV